ncbi:MAG: dockerin type I repeat-containing protein [Muribaculaceae bacterium]|nr:dockerin type I repeat-containing protein [Muribaculaceae bacterium]
MKRSLLLTLLVWVMLGAQAQVPQFSSTSFTDWVYTNPATELNSKNILNNKIYLYTTSTGLQLTLTSPRFTCGKGQVIDMKVTWITDQWQTEDFVVGKVGLTAAILDDDGVVRDSVTFTPTTVSRTNYLNLSIAVPRGMSHARLRFASWKADVNSNGAVRQIEMSSTLRADVNADNEVTIADVNVIISVILGVAVDDETHSRCDVNGDGEINLADVNDAIDVLLW